MTVAGDDTAQTPASPWPPLRGYRPVGLTVASPRRPDLRPRGREFTSTLHSQAEPLPDPRRGRPPRSHGRGDRGGRVRAARALVDRPGDHEIVGGDGYGARYSFGTFRNTTLQISTGCHLPEARRSEEPAAGPS
ncbi:LppA family lipoprotein [Pseudonocardia sp. H11422]|uniref:LppA family lipoprotein n=1 Tax=Pseudonocardia sp. H11422 TaxID=2835866 RepID=UPI001BDC6311|nr:LppA family lipoprotein [Pseudonocardia sp. H11422]